MERSRLNACHLTYRACCLAVVRAGSRIAINSAMIPITTSSSTKVKPGRPRSARDRFTSDPKAFCSSAKWCLLVRHILCYSAAIRMHNPPTGFNSFERCIIPKPGRNHYDLIRRAEGSGCRGSGRQRTRILLNPDTLNPDTFSAAWSQLGAGDDRSSLGLLRPITAGLLQALALRYS